MSQNFKIKLFISFIAVSQLWLIIGGLYRLPIGWTFCGVIVGIISYLRPKWAIYFILVFLIFAGTSPYKPPILHLVIISAFTILGIYSNLYLHNKRHLLQFIVKIRHNNIVLLLIMLFIFSNLISLVGLPILAALKDTVIKDPLYIFSEILAVGMHIIFYSFQSVLFLLQSFLIGLYLFGTCRAQDQVNVVKKVIFAIFLGWFIFSLFGLLDFFKFYDLEWYRRSNNAKLSSFFVSSSMAASYLAITIPLIPIVLLYMKRSFFSILIMLSVLIFGEIALVLSMQRGAYITYPPSIFIIWISIYFVIAKTRSPNLKFIPFIKKNWVKIFISVPITITLTIGIIYSVKDYKRNQQIRGAYDTFNQIQNRASIVLNSSGRSVYYYPSFLFFKENPIFGAGGDSFAWQYKEYFNKEGGKYAHLKSKTGITNHETSHNLYLQTLNGKGLFGLLFFLAFIFTLLFQLIKKEFLSGKQRPLEETIISLCVIGSLIASLIYGNVEVLFFIQPVSIVFWVMVFIGTTLVHNYRINYWRRKKMQWISKNLIQWMLLLLPFHVMHISFLKEKIASLVSNFFPINAGIVESGINWVVLIGVVLVTGYMAKKVVTTNFELRSRE